MDESTLVMVLRMRMVFIVVVLEVSMVVLGVLVFIVLIFTLWWSVRECL